MNTINGNSCAYISIKNDENYNEDLNKYSKVQSYLGRFASKKEKVKLTKRKNESEKYFKNRLRLQELNTCKINDAEDALNYGYVLAGLVQDHFDLTYEEEDTIAKMVTYIAIAGMFDEDTIENPFHEKAIYNALSDDDFKRMMDMGKNAIKLIKNTSTAEVDFEDLLDLDLLKAFHLKDIVAHTLKAKFDEENELLRRKVVNNKRYENLFEAAGIAI